MTINQPERLDRIEALVEANSRDIAQFSEMVAINSHDVAVIGTPPCNGGEQQEE